MNQSTPIPSPDAVVEPDPGVASIGRTARVIRESTPEEPPWLVPGMLALGSVTELNGREKVGKGYFLAYLLGSLERNEATVLGPGPGEPVRTLIFTEEPTQSLKEKFDLFDISDAMVVYQWELAGRPWHEVIEWLVQNAVRLECQLIFIDNISAATGVTDEAGVELARKVEPLGAKAKEHGLAVLYDRHQRKAPGRVEDLSRGSTALAGAVDVIVAMTKGDTRGTRERTLTSWGRLWATNWVKQVELSEDKTVYHALEGDWKERHLFDREEWTAKEFAAVIGATDDTARDFLETHPNVESRRGAGPRGATLYTVSRPPSLD